MEDQRSHISHFVVNCNGEDEPPRKDYIKDIDSRISEKLPCEAKRKARFLSNKLLRAFIRHKGLIEEEMDIPIDEWWLFIQDYERAFKSAILEELVSDAFNLFELPFAKDRAITMLFASRPKKCLLCETNPTEVTFIPCGHQFFCKGCISLLVEEINVDLNCLDCCTPIEAFTASNRPQEILKSIWKLGTPTRTGEGVDDNDIPIVP